MSAMSQNATDLEKTSPQPHGERWFLLNSSTVIRRPGPRLFRGVVRRSSGKVHRALSHAEVGHGSYGERNARGHEEGDGGLDGVGRRMRGQPRGHGRAAWRRPEADQVGQHAERQGLYGVLYPGRRTTWRRPRPCSWVIRTWSGRPAARSKSTRRCANC